MSNRACIEPTIFQDFRTGEKSYGVRVFDDYGNAYINTWDEIPDDDMSILKQVCKHFRIEKNTAIEGLFESVIENKTGIMIGEKWYDWEEIKSIINPPQK